MKAFKGNHALFVPDGDKLEVESQVKLMMMTSQYGMILFITPPPDTPVTDVTAEIEEKLKS